MLHYILHVFIKLSYHMEHTKATAVTTIGQLYKVALWEAQNFWTHLSQTHSTVCSEIAVHLGYGMQIWLSISNLPLKCAVVSMYTVVKQWLKCNTSKLFNCLIQFNSGSGLYRRSWTSLPTTFVSAQQFSKHIVLSTATIFNEITG
jgi:hypothetical protein